MKPVKLYWNGKVFLPAGCESLCETQFEAGRHYIMEADGERSYKSHNHYFAQIHDCWQNLPEALSERFPTAEHLRKWCLIREGYSCQITHVCGSEAEAKELAAKLKPVDEFSVVVARDLTVIIAQAKSQKKNSMEPKEFQESKTKVLERMEEMIGVKAA